MSNSKFHNFNSLMFKNWRRKPRFDYLIVLFMGLINSYVLIPNLKLSMAISASEEGPIQPSLIFKNPEIFEYDVFAQNNKYLMWTSSTKWVPALFYKYLNIDPALFHVLFTYSQTTFLLLAVFYLSKTLFKKSGIGLISVSLTIVLSPYFNNLGSYGDLYFMPYSTWISIPPLLFCIAYLINKKYTKSLLFFILGLSIHPAMAITTYGLIVATIFAATSPINKKKFKLAFLFLIPVIVTSLQILLIQHFSSANFVPKSWIIESKKLFHWSAWQLNPQMTTFQTTSYTICLYIATFLAVIYFKNLEQSVRKITILYFGIVFMSIFIQATAFSANIRGLYTINFTRVTIFMSILSVIIFSNILYQQLFEYKKLKFVNLFLIIFILIQSFAMLIVFSVIILVLIHQQTKKIIYRNIIKFSVFAVPTSFTLLFFASITKKWQLLLSPHLILDNILLVPNGIAIRALVEVFGLKSLFLILALFLILLLIRIRNESFIQTTTLVVMISIVLMTLIIRYVQSDIRFSKHSEWTSTQVWVQNNTEWNAKFILDGDLDTYSSWTTLTRRPRLTSANGPLSTYVYTKETVNLDEIKKIIGISPNFYEEANSLEKYYSSFSASIGGDFLVRRLEWTPLKWEVIYRNSQYIIYKIPLTFR